MIKNFQIFEATLRQDRTEFKFSKSKPSIKGLNKLTKWYNDNSISFIDLTKTGVSIMEINEVLSKDNKIILIKPTTFDLVRVGSYNLDNYRVYKIYGLPDNFPVRYAMISEADFINNKNYQTLNLNKLQRGDNSQERVFIKMLCKKLDCTMDNGLKINKYNNEWQQEIDYYKKRFPKNVKKMKKQRKVLLKQVGLNWDQIILDNSNFFINKKAKELFYKEEEFVKKGYIFSKDKWNPSDMWMVNGNIEDIKKTVNKFQNLEELNSWLSECIKENKEIIGVSLKINKHYDKVWLDKVNVDHMKAPFRHIYDGYIYKPSTMSIFINYTIIQTETRTRTKGSIEIRNNNAGKTYNISMEIKSNKGHMSGKLTSILRPLFSDTDFFRLQNMIIKSDKQTILDNIGQFKLLKHIENDFLDVLNNGKPMDYKENSKLQGLLIVNMIETHPKGADWVIDDMINYGRSQSSVSGPFYTLK